MVATNGTAMEPTIEEVLRLTQMIQYQGKKSDMAGYNGALRKCLSMTRGRRFVSTRGRRMGLAPAIGAKAISSLALDSGTEEVKATSSPIVILHECSIPIVLELANKELCEYRVVNDCYVEGILYGEAISWTEEHSDRDTFVLV